MLTGYADIRERKGSGMTSEILLAVVLSKFWGKYSKCLMAMVRVKNAGETYL